MIFWKDTAKRIVEGIVVALVVSYGEKLIEKHFETKKKKKERQK